MQEIKHNNKCSYRVTSSCIDDPIPDTWVGLKKSSTKNLSGLITRFIKNLFTGK